jgi:hypothetical protein
MTTKQLCRYFGVAVVSLVLACGPQGSSSNTNNNGNGSGNTPSGPGGGGVVVPADGGTPGCGQADFLFPPQAYSGFDGTHSFKVPFVTSLAGALTWTASDPTIATVTAIDPAKVPTAVAQPGLQWAMVTTTKAGTVTIKITNGTLQLSAKLTVTAYTTDQYNAGQTRYMTAPTGIIACTTCHSGAGGVDHTPTVTAVDSDSDLVSAITTATYPNGRTLNAPNHMFALSDGEKSGLVAYIRALAPKGF